MATRSYLVPGSDPTIYPDGDPIPSSVLLQLVDNGAPESDIGFFIISATAPDPVAHPDLARFGWVNSSTGALKRWNGSSWTDFNLLSSINGAALAAGSVALTALAPSGPAGGVVRLNLAGTGYEVVALSSLIASGSLTINVLEPLAGTSDYFLCSLAGSMAYASMTTAWTKLVNTAANRLAPAKISNPSPTSQSYALGFYAGAAAPEFRNAVDFIRPASIGTDKLTFSASWANKWTRVNSSLALEPVDAPTTSPPVALIYYQEPNGTDATFTDGTSTLASAATKQLRLNFEASDTAAIASVASNEVTLAAGSYEIEFWTNISISSSAVGDTKGVLILRDTTAAADLFAVPYYTDQTAQPHAICRLTFGAGVTLILNLENSGTVTQSLNPAANAGYVETYVFLKITKLS